MFTIKGKNNFYQWDLNQKLVVDDPTIQQVHFANGKQETALVVDVVEGTAAVPNILLQSCWDVVAYAYLSDGTKMHQTFKVIPREKPSDYVYTETEVRTWEELKREQEVLQFMLSNYMYVKNTWRDEDLVNIPLHRSETDGTIVAFWKFGGLAKAICRFGILTLQITTSRYNANIGKLTYTGEKCKYELNPSPHFAPYFTGEIYKEDLDKLFGEGFIDYISKTGKAYGLGKELKPGQMITSVQIHNGTNKFLVIKMYKESNGYDFKLAMNGEKILKPESILFEIQENIPEIPLYV